MTEQLLISPEELDAISEPSKTADFSPPQEGFHAFVVDKIIPKKAPWGAYQLSARVVPLADPDDVSTAVSGKSVFHQLELPVANREAGHEPDEQAKSRAIRNGRHFIRAMYNGETPVHPMFHKETTSWSVNGQEIPTPEANALRKESNAFAVNKLLELYNSEESRDELINKVFFARVAYGKEKTTKAGKSFTPVYLNNISDSLPPDAEITPV